MDSKMIGGILHVIILIGAAVLGYLSASLVVSYMKLRRLRKEENKKRERLLANKCKGAHSWITMDIDGGDTHVCKLCYYTPVHDNFVKEYYVKEHLEKKSFNNQFDEYMKEKLEEISKKYNIDISQLKGISEEIDKAKTDFSLDYLKRLLDVIKPADKE